MKSFVVILSLLACAIQPAMAQLTALPQQPIVGGRMPALSPDGKQIVFVYRGDLWLASSGGGRATSLTQHIET